MPALGEFLGHLMSEVTRARVHADLESARVAEMYASHPLLSQLAAPRFRLPEITLDVPVVINRVDAPPQDAALDRAKLAGAFREVLDAQRVKLTAPQRRAIESDIDDVLSAVDPNARQTNLVEVADALVDRTTARVPNAELQRLRTAARARFVNLRPSGATIDIGVATGDLAAAGAHNVTRFRLALHENGVEWTAIEHDGQRSARLVPE